MYNVYKVNTFFKIKSCKTIDTQYITFENNLCFNFNKEIFILHLRKVKYGTFS